MLLYKHNIFDSDIDHSSDDDDDDSAIANFDDVEQTLHAAREQAGKTFWTLTTSI